MTYQQSPFTNSNVRTRVTDRTLESDRLTFQPDAMFSLSTGHVVPMGGGNRRPRVRASFAFRS